MAPVGLTVGLGLGFVIWLLIALFDESLHGLVIGLVVGLTVAIMINSAITPEDADFASPVTLWRGDVVSTFMLGPGIGISVGLGIVWVTNLTAGWLSVGLGLIIGCMIPVASITAAVQVYFAIRYRTPVRLIRFLEDARERQLLRVVGPVYQFRHATLQDRLASDAAFVVR